MKLLYETLTGPLGGFDRENVLLMTDDAAKSMHRPTLPNLLTMIPRWLEDAGPKDDAFIAFSGHGLEEDGECYLLPRDAKRGNLRLTSVSVPQVRSWLEACKAQRKVLVLDACHSGAGRAVEGMGQSLKQAIEEGRGFLRLASCDRHQKSNEDRALGHGVFTYHLVKALRGAGDFDSDGRIGADEAYRYVARGVAHWARGHGLRQDPIMSGRVVGGLFTLCYAPKPDPKPSEASPKTQVAELFLTITPAHTTARVDGRPVPLREQGRVAFVRVLPGRHVIEVTKPGHTGVEKVVEVPAAGAEGIVTLAPLASQLPPRVEIQPKATTTIHGAISAGLISPLPDGTLNDQVEAFCRRWQANLEGARTAAELYAKGSPELQRIAQQKSALSLQAAELASRVQAEIRRAEELLRMLLEEGYPGDGLVARAAGEEVRAAQSLMPRLVPSLPKLTRTKLIDRIKEDCESSARVAAQQNLDDGGHAASIARRMAWCKQSMFTVMLFALCETDREDFRKRVVPDGPGLWIDKTALLPGEKVQAYFIGSPQLGRQAWVGLIPSHVRHGSTAVNDKHDLAYQYLSKRASGIMMFKAPIKKGLYDLRLSGPVKEAASVTLAVNMATGL